MNHVKRYRILMIVVLILASFCAIAYLAGVLYFALNKTGPSDVTVDTWWTYWQLYGSDRRQHSLLLTSAFMATLTVYGAPLAVLYTLRQKRSLHGDARWATEREIRKAGLL